MPPRIKKATKPQAPEVQSPPTAKSKSLNKHPATSNVSHRRERFQVLVDCGDETAQRRVYERLTAEGWSCRVLVL